MAKYTAAFVDSVKAKTDKRKNPLDEYSVEIDGEIGSPPLLEVVRFLTDMPDGLSVEAKERILRHSIIGKTVSIYYRGKRIDGFTLNDMRTPLDAFDVLARNPLALVLLIEICVSKMVEKSLPPLVESGPPAAADRTPGSQRPSGERSGGT